MTDLAFDRIRTELEKLGPVKTFGTDRLMARCPAHEDNNPSLSVRGIEGQALVYCHAGCDTRDVAEALGLKMSDLYDNPRGAEYHYDSGLVVHRSPEKRFWQTNTGKPRELYRLAKVAAAKAKGEAILVVEGEKDVHAAEKIGLTATCNPMGAGKWGKVDPAPLYGASVIVIADNDEPGKKHAAEVAASLAGHGGSVTVWRSAEGKDFADHVASGHTIADLVPVQIEAATADAGAEPDHTVRRVVLRSAAGIKPRRVRWLWESRVALGTLALIAGREGEGKSTVSYWAVAEITRGRLPGEFYGTPRDVLICATEDSWAHTIVPRLIAAGADLARVHQVEVLTADNITVGLSLPRDLAGVEHAARQVDAGMLLLDPLMSRLDESLDSHRDAEVRRALEPLAALADRCNMAVVGIIHHNKSGATDPLQLVMGSRAFTAVARSVHTVVRDPDDDAGERRLFGTPKNNLGRTDLPTLTFTIAGYRVETEEGDAWTGRVVWGDDRAESIAHAMERSNDNDRTATAEAAAWLEDYLKANGRAASADVKKDGAREGHSYDSLKRARQRIHAAVESTGFPRRTYWISAGHAQSEQQSEHLVRGESLTALTAPTEPQSVQSEQSEQSEGTGGQLAPTGETCRAAGCPSRPRHGLRTCFTHAALELEAS